MGVSISLPRACKARTLPIELIPLKNLSLTDRIRTSDLGISAEPQRLISNYSPPLYQLSYGEFL